MESNNINLYVPYCLIVAQTIIFIVCLFFLSKYLNIISYMLLVLIFVILNQLITKFIIKSFNKKIDDSEN